MKSEKLDCSLDFLFYLHISNCMFRWKFVLFQFILQIKCVCKDLVLLHPLHPTSGLHAPTTALQRVYHFLQHGTHSSLPAGRRHSSWQPLCRWALQVVRKFAKVSVRVDDWSGGGIREKVMKHSSTAADSSIQLKSADQRPSNVKKKLETGWALLSALLHCVLLNRDLIELRIYLNQKSFESRPNWNQVSILDGITGHPKICTSYLRPFCVGGISCSFVALLSGREVKGGGEGGKKRGRVKRGRGVGKKTKSKRR